MPDIEWLLREPDRALTVQTGPPFAADDDNWRATIERVIVAPSLHVYLVDAQAHRDMSIEPTHEFTDPFVASQLTIEGRADLDFQSAGRAHATPDNTVFFRPPRQTTAYRLKAGTRFRAAGYALSVDRMVRLFEGEVPAALAPLLEPDLDDTRFVTARSDKVIRSLAVSLFAGGLNGPLRRLMMEGAVVHLLALQAAAAGCHAARHRPAALSPRSARPSPRPAVCWSSTCGRRPRSASWPTRSASPNGGSMPGSACCLARRCSRPCAASGWSMRGSPSRPVARP